MRRAGRSMGTEYEWNVTHGKLAKALAQERIFR